MRDYNFFEIYEKKRNNTSKFKSPAFYAVVVVLILVVASAGLVLHNTIMKSRIKALDADIEQIKASEEYIEAENLQRSIQAMKEYDKNAEVALIKLDESRVLGSKFISKLASVIPVNTWIVHMEVDPATLMIDFSIPNKREGAELILALKNSGLFSNVHANNIFKDKNGERYMMSLQCDLKAGEVK